MTYEAIIFDCDGVLVNSEKVGSEVELRLLRSYGCEVIEEELRAECFGKTAQENFAYYRKHWADKIPDNFEEEFKQGLEESFHDNLEAVAGVEDTIALLALPKAVASNSYRESLTLMLSKTRLIDYFFGCIFGADMVERGKPAPDLYLAAAEKLGVDPQKCLVIEDSPTGVKAAKAAGMSVLGFTGGGHTFVGHDQVLRMAGAFDIITEFPQILNFVSDLPVKQAQG